MIDGYKAHQLAYDFSTPFWERAVDQSVGRDLDQMQIYRKRQFPAEQGPAPWLDGPDPDAQIAARQSAGVLTDWEAELCRKWARDGYVILKGFYDPKRLDKTWADYEKAIRDGVITPPDEPYCDGDMLPGRVANIHFSIPSLNDMLFEPRMSRLIGILLGARARPFQTIIGHKGSQQLEHSDSIHMSTYPEGYLAANWIAYEDIDPDSGPLLYYPGSHRLPYILSEDLNMPQEAGYESYHRIYEPKIQAVIREHNLAAERFTPQKGDVLIWHANLLHGGARVINPKLSRKALVCHFFAEGCVCYHDLTGTLTHTQLGLDLYRFTPNTTSNAAQPEVLPIFEWLRAGIRRLGNHIRQTLAADLSGR